MLSISEYSFLFDKCDKNNKSWPYTLRMAHLLHMHKPLTGKHLSYSLLKIQSTYLNIQVSLFCTAVCVNVSVSDEKLIIKWNNRSFTKEKSLGREVAHVSHPVRFNITVRVSLCVRVCVCVSSRWSDVAAPQVLTAG